MKYAIEREEPVSKPYVIGNTIFPYKTWEWKEVALSDSKETLEELVKEWSEGRDIRLGELRVVER